MTPITGTFTDTGSSASILVPGSSKSPKHGGPVYFNVSMDFVGTASVTLQRAFPDAPTVWYPVAVYTADISAIKQECEPALYRLTCTAHTDNVAYRLSR